MRYLGIATVSLAMLATTLQAETSTLVVGIEDYDRISDVRRGDTVYSLNDFFEPEARVSANPDAGQLRALIARYETSAQDMSSQIIVLSGRFVHSAAETYFLPSDASPAAFSTITTTALPLSTVLAFLAETPGDAVLALATDDADGAFGDLLDFGIGDLDLPQGVSVLSGDPRSVTSALTDLLRNPSRQISRAARRSGVEVSGFLRETQTLRFDAPEVPEATSQSSQVADLLAWRRADRANTAESYQAYLDAHPRGRFVTMAQGRLQSLLETPEARAERAEQRLDLTRDQRRGVQRALTLLDYDTRGIDGIFGRGTRGAVGAWQRDNGFEETGFLDEEQIRQLDAQARRRAEQLEAEAEERRQAQLALDRAFWEESGAGNSAAGNEAYLERYPDGQFADIARENLAEIEREKRRQATLLDRDAWNAARMEDTVSAYQTYIDADPNGAFQDEARARIRQLQNENSGEVQQARREEDALRLAPQTRRLIESRLQRLGLEPGPVDGTFTEETRRAIRRYQEARNLPQTGYLSEDVIVRLLADSVRSIFR